MKLTITFDPEDGTGPLTKHRAIYDPHSFSPDGLWYNLVKAMKELIHDWQWRRAGKPTWSARDPWKTEARKWTEPIDVMIAAVKEAERD